jgi:hypothetical protein
VSFGASFAPVKCSSEAELRSTSRALLPPASAGEYEVSAIMDVTVGSNAELVTGPLSSVRLK